MQLIANSTVWYAARAGGIVAYLLVTACVLAGVGLAGKVTVPGLPRFAVEDIHRFLGLLAGTFVALHVSGIVLDTTVSFSPGQVLVPFTASYRPLWTGFGVVALELLVALAVTNRLRPRLPHRLWRRVHYASFAVWALATLHGFMSGTDRDQLWLQLVYAVAVAAVAGAVTLRLRSASEAGRRAPRAPARVAADPASIRRAAAGTVERGAPAARLLPLGEVAERSNAAVSKTVTGR